MKLKIHSTTSYTLLSETFILLKVEPRLSGKSHRVLNEELATSKTKFSELLEDHYGNIQRRLIAPKGQFYFDFTALIETDPNQALPLDAEQHLPSELPSETLVYTLASRYCQSDLLRHMANDEFGSIAPGGGRVQAISEWVQNHVEYLYGTTDSATSAYDTATQRRGVCRDFAHLTIAFCRALDIPARYVSGYALGLEPPDFHSFAQVYLGGNWHNVDATCQGVRPALVPIAAGRDAADVAITTLFGSGNPEEQLVEVSRVDSSMPRIKN